jgi:Thiamine monophosphate kinase
MNEFELIQGYFNWSIKEPSIALGIGDDAALFSIKDGQQLVTTTDTLSEVFTSLKMPCQVTLLINP